MPMPVTPLVMTVKDKMDKGLIAIQNHFDADGLLFYGEIIPTYSSFFGQTICDLKQGSDKEKLVIILHTPGGSAETVEKFVDIIRYYYSEVYFIVPHQAMSAGTIFCMSGDKIYMDFQSSLGPIDPLVFNGKSFVPALGYLDQFDKLIKKSADMTITPAEMQLIMSFDLADLSHYEQARNLTITLLKKWLVEYKFKNWEIHRTNPEKNGQPVTQIEKMERAEEIAVKLGDNSRWHSHSRYINLNTLKNELKLEIEDYSSDLSLRKIILDYMDLADDFLKMNNVKVFLHTVHCFF